MDDPTLDLLGLGSNSILGLDQDLNGSTAPNSSPLITSSPVDTSNGNTNTSGSWLSTFINGLSGVGTTAANAYKLFSGSTSPTAAKPATTTSTLTTYLPWILIGGGLLIVLLLVGRRK